MPKKSKKKVLIIGGAGFIGSHTADELFANGYDIKILDNLNPKTHFGKWPEYLNKNFEFVKGDVRDQKTLRKALDDVDYVYHLAAEMDLMPNFSVFFDTNATSTASLYEIIVRDKLPIKKVVVASSQFVYGEGKGLCKKHGEVNLFTRSEKDLSLGKWDPKCPFCNKKTTLVANKESHQRPANQYAISKYAQELIATNLAKVYEIPSAAMRYSIVQGPRQSLKNAYSGALRIFTLQLLNNKPASIYEDGLSLRDYVSVYDVARANRIVLENDKANYQAYNVGGGKKYTVIDLFNQVAKALNKDINPKPTNEYRVGDVRHNISDISKLKKLGWKPHLRIEDYVQEYIDWVKSQKLDKDYLKEAEMKMKESNIIRKATS